MLWWPQPENSFHCYFITVLNNNRSVSVLWRCFTTLWNSHSTPWVTHRLKTTDLKKPLEYLGESTWRISHKAPSSEHFFSFENIFFCSIGFGIAEKLYCLHNYISGFLFILIPIRIMHIKQSLSCSHLNYQMKILIPILSL